MPSLLRPLSVGEILDGAFALYRRNFVRIVGVAAIPFAAIVAIGLVTPLVAIILSIPATILIQGALVWTSSELIHERDPGYGDALKIGLFRLVPLGLVTIAFTIVIGFGMVLLFIPGLIAMVFFFPYQQAVVIERRLNFLDRGMQLVRKGFWKCAAVVFISYVIVIMPTLILVAGQLTMTDQLDSMQSPLAFGWQQIAQYGVSSLTYPFTALVTTLLYYERRVTVEGFDVEQSAHALEESLRASS